MHPILALVLSTHMASVKVCGPAARREGMAKDATQKPNIAIFRLIVIRQMRYIRLIGHRVLLLTKTYSGILMMEQTHPRQT